MIDRLQCAALPFGISQTGSKVDIAQIVGKLQSEGWGAWVSFMLDRGVALWKLH